MTRDELAAEIYLRLLASHPGMNEEWRRDESIKRADEFVKQLAASKQKTRKRNEVVTA